MPTGWPQPLQVPIIRLAIGRHARGVPRLRRWLGAGSDWRAGAHHEVSECLHDLLRRRPGLAVSNRPAVNLDNRCDFRRGTRDERLDRKSTRLNSSHPSISYAVFCLKKKNKDHVVLDVQSTTTAA